MLSYGYDKHNALCVLLAAKLYDGSPVTNVSVTCGPNVTLQSVQLTPSSANVTTDMPMTVDAEMTANSADAVVTTTTTTMKSETPMPVKSDAATVSGDFITKMSIVVVALRLLRSCSSRYF